MAEIGLRAPERWSDLKVAYHSACSMQHGQLDPLDAAGRGSGLGSEGRCEQ